MKYFAMLPLALIASWASPALNVAADLGELEKRCVKSILTTYFVPPSPMCHCWFIFTRYSLGWLFQKNSWTGIEIIQSGLMKASMIKLIVRGIMLSHDHHFLQTTSRFKGRKTWTANERIETRRCTICCNCSKIPLLPLLLPRRVFLTGSNFENPNKNEELYITDNKKKNQRRLTLFCVDKCMNYYPNECCKSGTGGCACPCI